MKLVLLPGLDGTGVLFRPLLRALPADIAPIVVCYPVDQALGYDALLARVLKELPAGEPFVLLGESFGGPLSLRIVAERPKGLRGLILCASFVSCPHAFVPQWVRHLVTSWPFRFFPKFAQIKGLLGGYGNRELLALSTEALTQVSPHVFAHRLREVVSVDVSRELKSCEVPVMYLQGRHDMVVPASNLLRIQALRPSVRSVRIDAPHMVLQTQPVIAAQTICNFIAELQRTE